MNTTENQTIQPQISPPIPEVPYRSPEKSNIPLDIFRRLEIVESDFVPDLSFHGGSQKRSGLKLALWTWFSATIDTLVLISLSCFFIVVFSFLMKATPGSMLGLFVINQSFIGALVILFLVSVWSYLVFMRVFMGASIGEWTCDLRIGQPLQRFKFSYLFRVILRSSVVVGSGLIVLPILSLLFSRDIAGDISGVKIYSLE